VRAVEWLGANLLGDGWAGWRVQLADRWEQWLIRLTGDVAIPDWFTEQVGGQSFIYDLETAKP
jgi:hypothetical protein